jgi:large repetitive protein
MRKRKIPTIIYSANVHRRSGDHRIYSHGDFRRLYRKLRSLALCRDRAGQWHRLYLQGYRDQLGGHRIGIGVLQRCDTPVASQTTAFNNPGSQVYGTSPTLTATDSSGLAATFSSSTPGVCSITSTGTLVFSSIGTCTIVASQGGNGGYLAASPVQQSFTLNQASLSITAYNATRVYGTANPAFTGIVLGAANLGSFTESFSTTATTNSNAGQYPIAPSVAGAGLADYNVTATSETLTVTQAATAITLTASAASVTPG